MGCSKNTHVVVIAVQLDQRIVRDPSLLLPLFSQFACTPQREGPFLFGADIVLIVVLRISAQE